MDDLNVILPELKRALLEHYGDRLVKLILYGSHARGEATEDSDIDVLVVIRDLTFAETRGELWDITEISARFSYNFDTLISIRPVGYEDYKKRMSPLLINVREEGKELWPETSR